MKMKIDDIKFRKDLYPRIEPDFEIVNSYRLNLDKLPPIVISKNKILIDGYHRLLAHKLEKKEEIEVKKLKITDEKKILLEAIKRNSTHGKQLSIPEKKRASEKLFPLFSEKTRIKKIVKILSVSERTVLRWTKDIRKDEKDERNQKILDLWLGCKTQEEIAEEVGLADKSSVNKILDELKKRQLSEIQPPDSLHLFNLWNISQCSDEYGIKDYEGRMPGQIVENLLYYFTQPFDVVLDPMAGSGTTLDVCKRYYRRYIGFDINPIETKGIIKNDITKGIPIPKHINPVDFVLLDPPYGQQKKGKYTKKITDLSNLSLDKFYEKIEFIAQECKRLLKDGGKLAFIIGNSTIEKNKTEDLAFNCFEILKKYFKPIIRIIIPYGNALKTENANPQVSGATLQSAKDGKFMLKIYRDLMVFER